MEDIEKFLNQKLPEKKPLKNIQTITNQNTTKKKIIKSKTIEESSNELNTNILNKEKEFLASSDSLRLKEIYNEVKKFDKDLFNNFFNTEKTSSKVLKNISSEFSKDSLNRFKINQNRISLQFEKVLKNISIDINSMHFFKAELQIKQLKKKLYLLSENYQFFKLKHKNKLFVLENEMISKFMNFKKTDLIKKSEEIKIETNKLENFINNKNIKDIEESSKKLEKLIISISIYGKLSSKIIFFANKMLIKSENYLFEAYLKEKEKEEQKIEIIFGEFYKYYLEKNVEKSIGIYKKIIEMYDKITPNFPELKIEVQNKINEMLANINDLMMGENMSKFLNSYWEGKREEKAESYLNFIKKTKNIDIIHIEKILKELKLEKNNSSKKEVFKLEQLILEYSKILTEEKSNIENLKKNSTFKKQNVEEKSQEKKNINVEEKSKNPNEKILIDLNKKFKLYIVEKDKEKRGQMYDFFISEIAELEMPEDKKNELIKKLQKY
jgi:hypothetical protein